MSRRKNRPSLLPSILKPLWAEGRVVAPAWVVLVLLVPCLVQQLCSCVMRNYQCEGFPSASAGNRFYRPGWWVGNPHPDPSTALEGADLFVNMFNVKLLSSTVFKVIDQSGVFLIRDRGPAPGTVLLKVSSISSQLDSSEAHRVMQDFFISERVRRKSDRLRHERLFKLLGTILPKDLR